MNFENYMHHIIYAFVYIIFVVAMKAILNFKSASHYSADEQISDGNMAVGLRRSGAQLGLAIAMVGVLSGSGTGSFASDLLNTTSYGALALAFMITSLFFTDKVILPNVDNTAELRKGNVAVGIIEFAVLVMTGLIAYASIKGDDGGAISSIIYFVAGQLSLIVLILLYEKVFAGKLNPVEHALKGNMSAGIYLAGKIISYGLILQSAIVGNGIAQSNTDAALQFVATAVAGMVVLYLFEIVIDVLIITSVKVSDIIIGDHKVAAIQLSLAKIGMALILGMAIL